MRAWTVVGLIVLVLAAGSSAARADDPDDPYVVNTNWTITDHETGAGIFNPGYGVDPDPGRANYLPAYDDYDWMFTDDEGVRQSELQALLDSWTDYCQPEIEGVDVLNRIEDLQTGINRIQIVADHVVVENHVPAKALFTITFPPNFSIDEQHRYPLVIVGTGWGGKGLNGAVFTHRPINITRVKSSYLFDQHHRGIVHVRWNVGGLYSMGVNDGARQALNRLIQQLHGQYGCDRDRIIAYGGSRGAFAALTTAENTVHQTYDYTVIGVFAMISPMAIGDLSEYPVATYSCLTSTYSQLVGPNAARYTSDPPPGMNPQLLVPSFGTDPGGNDLLPQRANQLSPDHPDNLQALQGKYIWMSYSLHDCYSSPIGFLEMDNRLSEQGVEHTSFIILQGGHGSAATSIADEVFKDFLDYVMNEPGFNPADYRPLEWKHGLDEEARNYMLETDLNTHLDALEPLALAALPFSVTLPYRLGCNVFGGGVPGVANEPGIAILTGAEGKSWEVTVRRREPDGSLGAPHSWSGTFDETESDIIRWWPGRPGWDEFPVYATGSGGVFYPDNDWLEWTVSCDGFDYSDYTNWMIDGQRLPPRTEIMSRQAYSDELHASYDASGDGGTGFGVDAIPALPWVNLTCTPSSGTAPIEVTCAVTAGCYAPVNRTLAYSVDLTLADGTVLTDYWQGAMSIGPDESLAGQHVRRFYRQSELGINTLDVTVLDITPSPYNQPPFPPSGLTNSAFSVVTIAAPISDPVRQQQWLLNSPPGWTAEGGWAFGRPLGAGGQSGGHDPVAGKTNLYALAYNLAGDYPNNLAAEHLVSTPIDCTGLSNVRLKFWRWLGVEHPDYDHASIEVSAHGGGWVTVWENETEIADTSWVLMDLNISEQADDQPDVYLRWTMGPTDDSLTYCGWNIDDIEIWANEPVVPTIIDMVSCVPSSGVVPFTTHMKYAVTNCCNSHRRVATRVDADLANGTHFSNWRSGYQNIVPQGSATAEWNQTIPALGSLIGDNLFTWDSRDVTPPPYNQPPHTPSGSACGNACTVTGLAP